MKIVTAEQMQNIDRMAASQGLSTAVLMENAGKVVAEEMRKAIGNVAGNRILAIIGPGNNGGDGLVAARYLSDWGAEISVYLCNERAIDDRNLIRLAERGVPIIQAEQDTQCTELDRLLDQTETVIDAIFGTGRSRVIDGVYKIVLTTLNDVKIKRPGISVFAVDMPSGMDADTGEVDPCCSRADMTITLGYPKPGFFTFPGADYAGRVIIADIGIPTQLAENITTGLITREIVKSILPDRPANANKGSFGKVLIIAGSINYVGAAYLACMGAARSGAGLVTLATPKSLIPILAAKLTETTYIPLPEKNGAISPGAVSVIRERLKEYKAVLMGCGIGQQKQTVNFVKSMLDILRQSNERTLIFDADALNILSLMPDWWQKLPGDAILTPHPGEMGKLCGISIEEVQRKRLETARQSAQHWHKVVVLKGAYSIIASPDGQTRINDLAYQGLASAGTGDVLAGIIAGLAAQGVSDFDAAVCGVYLHGEAGLKAGHVMGDVGMLAGDLIPVLPKVISEIKEQAAA